MEKLIVLSCFLAVALGASLDGKIVGGQTGNINNFPYQVSIQLANEHFCGGSILDQDTILTAAHCLVDKDDFIKYLTIRAGSSDYRSGGQQIKVKSFVIHEDYEKYILNDNDIAIIKLQSSLKFGVGVAAIQPETGNVQAGNKAIVSGWGVTQAGSETAEKIIRFVELKVISDEDCRIDYTGREYVTDNMICTSTRGKDACQGDSGGPMVVAGKLVGVVSWGLGCAAPGSPGVYAKVSQYGAWIASNK